MKVSLTLGMGILAATLLQNLATGAIVFQDDFNGTNGTPFDPTKWAVSVQLPTSPTATPTATIQGNQGKVYNPNNSDAYEKIWVSSNTGVNFLTVDSTTYSGTLASLGGPYSEGNFGVKNAVTFSYVLNGDWSATNVTLNVSVGTKGSVGSFTINANQAHDFTVIMTPTTYSVSMSNVLSGTTLTGSHSLTSGTYTGGGIWNMYMQDGASWVDSQMTFDSIAISVVPEPASLALLALGGLALLRRRR